MGIQYLYQENAITVINDVRGICA